MEVTGSTFPKELINLSRIDIYGKPSQSLLDKLRLSETTGSTGVFVHEHSSGFSRFLSSRTGSFGPQLRLYQAMIRIGEENNRSSCFPSP